MPIRRLMLLIIVAAALLAACAGAPAVPTALPTPAAPTAGTSAWLLVSVGDSIPLNRADKCPGCTSFQDRYAAAITKATGHPVQVQNLSHGTDHGMHLDDTLADLKTDTHLHDALVHADIIIISIGHDDTAWNREDDPCNGPNDDASMIDWSKFTATCATAAAEVFRPKFENVFSQIVALRAGKPTIFRVINVYNAWLGVPGSTDSPAGANATRIVLDAWSAMTCKAAQANGVTCADIYHAFNGPDGLKPAPDLLAEDTVHPSDKGNAVIARVLVDLGYAPLAP